MSAVIGKLGFKLAGTTPFAQWPARLVWDSLEIRWESVPTDINDPNQIKKRRVLTVATHVDVQVREVSLSSFRTFTAQEEVSDVVVQMPKQDGGFKNTTYVGDYDIITLKAARVGEGPIARISLVFQSKAAYADTTDAT